MNNAGNHNQVLCLRLLQIYLQMLFELFYWVLNTSKDKFKEALNIRSDCEYKRKFLKLINFMK